MPSPSAKSSSPQASTAVWRDLLRVMLRVTAGWIAVIALLTVVRFPYHTDPAGVRTVARPADYQAFYAKIYAAPRPVSNVGESVAAEDDEYVEIARRAIEDARIVPRIREFVRDYKLERARVLDVGSGTGYLQDTVDGYVGLDISPTASRYYHKPFIEASATEMPIPDNDFDAAWSIWVLEHVPNPEQALFEIRRVVKDGGLIYLLPAWNCDPWAAQGYLVRPFSDYDWKGKVAKASMYALDFGPLEDARLWLTRRALAARRYAGGPTRLHYNPLTPNYDKYWVADGDAVASIDRYETALWFLSRGDECLNCDDNIHEYGKELIIRVRK